MCMYVCVCVCAFVCERIGSENRQMLEMSLKQREWKRRKRRGKGIKYIYYSQRIISLSPFKFHNKKHKNKILNLWQ